jgi:trehalose 6-phosphate phosphatase
VVLIDTIDIRTSAVLLDVDGTLLDIAETPPRVEVPAQLKWALEALAGRNGGATSFVSGRSLTDLDRLFAPLKLAAVAGHGAELRMTGGAVPHRQAAAIPGQLRDSLVAFAASNEGVIFEDKGYSQALHYRLAPQRAEAVYEAVLEACAHYPPGMLDVLPGKSVLEVKLTGFSKGSGIRELMQTSPFRGRRPIFIGDDITDESAFAVLPEFGGLGFSVGRELPGLAGSFETPGDVRAWLYRIVDGVGASAP